MAPGRAPCLSFLIIVSLSLACMSCVRIMPPGIMPPHENDAPSQWRVLHQGFTMVPGKAGQTRHQWQIIARYIPDGEGGSLTPFDLSATIDGFTVPFTFEEDAQIFESMTSSPPSSGPHRFSLSPSERARRAFPTLTVEFEAP